LKKIGRRQRKPICFSPEEFEKEELPIVRDIKREGVEISASNQ